MDMKDDLKETKSILKNLWNLKNFKKKFQKDPQFNLSYYEKDWDRAGQNIHHAWDNLGVRIGVKVTPPGKQEQVLKRLIEEFPGGVTEPMNLTTKEKLREIWESVEADETIGKAPNKIATVAVAAVTVASATATTLKSGAKVVGETVKTAGIIAGFKAAMLVNSGWQRSKSLKDRLVKKITAKEEVKEEVKEEAKEEAKEPDSLPEDNEPKSDSENKPESNK